ncbi:hypothetical protein H5410_030012 [Solanum commersonii]|uniref:Uncharacterized protein n=1 Tax=Solanum commersonii TaxID=4109 RepID=A0A9J5YEJ7_SOLCO|nr:hypothetical protein H5410_030012 [Solanum commersonii]
MMDCGIVVLLLKIYGAKKEDSRLLHFAKALCDLVASINLIPLSIYKKLGTGDPKPSLSQCVINGDRERGPESGVLKSFRRFCDSLRSILRFPSSLGDHFLLYRCALVHEARMGSSNDMPAITYRVESGSKPRLKKRLGVEACVMMNFDSDGIEEYNELVAALDKHEYGPNQKSQPTRPSIEKAPKLELKALPCDLSIKEIQQLLGGLLQILWDPHGFALIKSNSYEHKPGIKHQRRLNPLCKRFLDGEFAWIIGKLNAWTEKDHFPVPFMDRMLDRLARKGWYCFLDGSKTKATLHLSYGTFAFKRMLLGCVMLGNARDMVEDAIGVFMDDF